MSALAIRNRLNINLSDYIFCGVSPDTKGAKSFYNSSNIGEILKTQATSAIKKIYKFRTGNTNSIIANLNADKLNISDIFLCKKNDQQIKQFIQLIENANDIETNNSTVKKALKDLTNPKDILKYKGTVVSKFNLNISKYVRIMNTLFDDKSVIGVSLKKIKPVPDNYNTVPFSVLGSKQTLPSETDKDKFFQFVATLIKFSKYSSFAEFEAAIEEFIVFDKKIKFTGNDRLEVPFTFNYQSGKSPYIIFTNFGSGNNFYFQPRGAGGYHEGGITVERFVDIANEFPDMGKLFKDMAAKREEYFNAACKKNGFEGGSRDVYQNKKIASNYKLSNTKNLIYSSTKYHKFISQILGTSNNQSRIVPISKSNGKVRVLSSKLISKSKTNSSEAERYYELTEEYIEEVYFNIIAEFFKSYTDYLSSSQNSMGNFARLKSSSEREMEMMLNKIKKSKDIKESRNIAKSAFGNISKSYAILSNAEFGFIFAKHNEEIAEILKKKTILSLYSMATGRGFISFNGQKFKIDKIYIEDFRTPRYIKIGN